MKIDKLFRTLNLGFCSLILLFVFNGCGMPIQTIAYDDVYATNLKEHEPFIAEDSDNAIYQDNSYVKKKQHYRELIKVEDSIAEQENFNAEELQTEYDVNYAEFDEEDYYDYAYSARLRRFYHPVVYRDYYADYYTNLYWYTYDPFCWGTSIYLGYSWWYPSYYSSLYWDPFYNPYWHHHHFHHHHHHHHSHYDVCYFNSMDYNSNMYRGSSVGGSIKRAGNVSGSSIKKHITRNDNKTVKPSSNKKVVYTNNAKRYNKPANSTNRMKPGVNRGGKVSTINRQTNKNTNLFNRSNSRSSNSSKSYNRGSGSSINRSGGTRSSGSSFGGGSRGGSRSGGSIRR
jgi:hypothetical protein